MTRNRMLMAAGAAIALIGFGLWMSGHLASGKRATVEARLNANRADAAIATASDAVASIASQAAAEAAHDQLTRENEDEIRNAPGAAAPVDPRLHDAGLRSLCRRAAYRDSQQCLQFAAPR